MSLSLSYIYRPQSARQTMRSICIPNGFPERNWNSSQTCALLAARHMHHSLERERIRERVMFVRATSPFLLLSGPSSSGKVFRCSAQHPSRGKRAIVNRFLLRAKASSSETQQRTENVESTTKCRKRYSLNSSRLGSTRTRQARKPRCGACKMRLVSTRYRLSRT